MWVRFLGTQFLPPQKCSGFAREVQMWVALLPVAFVAAESSSPAGLPLCLSAPATAVGAAPASPSPGSPGVPEAPKKNSQNILGIPGMSQNNIKTLFSFNN